MRNLVGHANWDAAVTRTAAVFRAAGVTPELSQWHNEYVGENAQEAMLNIESALLGYWANEHEPSLMTGGMLYVQLIKERIAEAELLLQQHAAARFRSASPSASPLRHQHAQPTMATSTAPSTPHNKEVRMLAFTPTPKHIVTYTSTPPRPDAWTLSYKLLLQQILDLLSTDPYSVDYAHTACVRRMAERCGTQGAHLASIRHP
jgi:hypothetical protein